jgi:hypothetical protein
MIIRCILKKDLIGWREFIVSLPVNGQNRHPGKDLEPEGAISENNFFSAQSLTAILK